MDSLTCPNCFELAYPLVAGKCYKCGFDVLALDKLPEKKTTWADLEGKPIKTVVVDSPNLYAGGSGKYNQPEPHDPKEDALLAGAAALNLNLIHHFIPVVEQIRANGLDPHEVLSPFLDYLVETGVITGEAASWL